MTGMNGVTVTSALSKWERPLRTWFDVLDRYRTASASPDVAYWYNERATLSTVAGALWLAGYVVLEEYCTRRGGNGPDAGTGRTDLWCKLDGEEYTVEAKQDVKLAYPAKPSTLSQWADFQLSLASAQCASDDFGATNRLAMVFMVPSLKSPPTDAALEEWTAVVDGFEADVKAHYLNAPGIQSPKNSRFFPGVVLLGRLVPPSSGVLGADQ
jgi:hypothetical protein